jgi:pyrimidine deaminase RibD-like protein
VSKRDRAYLSVARYLARKSSERMKHGAVVVKGGRVLGTGYNKGRNHPFIVSSEHIKEHCSRHAEVEAIRDANYNVKGAVIYVARVNRSGHDRDSKPCERCQEFIDAAGIKRVIHTMEK